MTAIKKALDHFANGYEEITGSMLPADLRANLKRALLAGVYGFEYDPGIMTRAILAYGDRFAVKFLIKFALKHAAFEVRILVKRVF